MINSQLAEDVEPAVAQARSPLPSQGLLPPIAAASIPLTFADANHAVGSRVTLHDLSKAEFNGSQVIIKGYTYTSSRQIRYKVELSNGLLISVKPINIMNLGILPGSLVEIYGLKNKSRDHFDYNGQTGYVTHVDANTQRYVVSFPEFTGLPPISVRHEKLRTPGYSDPCLETCLPSFFPCCI